MQSTCGCSAQMASSGVHSCVSRPIQTYKDHQAAVKGLDWSPHRYSILASGGGTADRSVDERLLSTCYFKDYESLEFKIIESF